jgi:transposase
MDAIPYPTDLTDAEWDLIKELIPPPKPGGRRLELDMRAVLNAIFYVWVDGTYRGQLVEWVAQHMRFVLRPVLRPDGCKGFLLLPRRWVVECTLAWLNQSRRLSKDYERLPKSSEAMIYLSMTRLMLRRLVAT